MFSEGNTGEYVYKCARENILIRTQNALTIKLKIDKSDNTKMKKLSLKTIPSTE